MNLDPGSEYLYNISMYDGKEHVIVEVNKTLNINKNSMWIKITCYKSSIQCTNSRKQQ